MSKESIFSTMYRFRYLGFLLAISIFYFSSSNWVNNATNEEINEYIDGYNIEKPVDFLEPMKLLIQVIVGMIFVVMLFYIGRIHDLTKDYIGKLGVFEEAILTVTKNKKHSNKVVKKEIENKPSYENDLKYFQNTPASIIIVSVLSLGFFILIFFKIFQSDVDDDLRKLASLIFSLASAIGNFAMLWAFFNYMITNRQNDYKELIYSIARIRAEINSQNFK